MQKISRVFKAQLTGLLRSTFIEWREFPLFSTHNSKKKCLACFAHRIFSLGNLFSIDIELCVSCISLLVFFLSTPFYQHSLIYPFPFYHQEKKTAPFSCRSVSTHNRPSINMAQVKSLKNQRLVSEDELSFPHILDPVRAAIAKAMACALIESVPEAESKIENACSVLAESIGSKIQAQIMKDSGDLALPMFAFIGLLKKNKIQFDITELATSLAEKTTKAAADAKEDDDLSKVVDVKVGGSPRAPFLNIYLVSGFMAQIVDMILNQGFFEAKSDDGKDRVMVEYSQPNTHKAFHVGHMRNVALGDCLVRMWKHMGYPVVAANYFGDEGAHVAKCLWYLRRFYLASGNKLEDVPEADRAEFLGNMYSMGVSMLDLSNMTSTPYPGIVVAEIKSIDKHPNAEAPANWHHVKLDFGPDAAQQGVDVICGGIGYKVGDKVAYAPVGIKFNKNLIAPKDMKGVESHGLIVGRGEVGLKDEAKLPPPPAVQPLPEPKEDAKAEEAGGKKKKKKKKGKKGKGKAKSNQIYVLDTDAANGTPLPELGRIKDDPNLPADKPVLEELAQRNKEVGDCLRAMENKDAEMCALWEETKQWSLAEFRNIYKWCNATFDHDFYESEVSEPSQKLVDEFLAKDVFVNRDGAVGCDLSDTGHGFCMVRKSNGAGLYATKDLSLAQKKFEEFKIDKSIYVVDAGQTLHFQQVFATLSKMGYEQSQKCFHLPYGIVTLPSGKMSSRGGSVIFFSSLRQMLYDKIYNDYLIKYKDDWEEAEIEEAKRCIAVGIIRFGMLDFPPDKDIVFEMDKWSSTQGKTGTYMMYAYARVNKILRDIPEPENATVDYKLLNNDIEREILMHLSNFWNVFAKATATNNPSPTTDYMFDLAKKFSMWYKDHSVKHAETPDLQLTRIRFVTAIREAIRVSLSLLGVKVLGRM
jgi:arginyl-tRNA synthetase